MKSLDFAEDSNMILEYICIALNTKKDLLIGKTRKREIVEKRAAAALFMIKMFPRKNNPRATMTRIGLLFNRDHTAICHYKKLLYRYEIIEIIEHIATIRNYFLKLKIIEEENIYNFKFTLRQAQELFFAGMLSSFTQEETENESNGFNIKFLEIVKDSYL